MSKSQNVTGQNAGSQNTTVENAAVQNTAAENVAIQNTAAENAAVQDVSEMEFKVSPVSSSAKPILYDPKLCIGCNRCVQVCQCDILFPSGQKGEHPIVMYPGECYYCGACVMACPNPGAITLKHPLMNQAKFVPVK